MRIVVLGATGYVGSRAVPALAAAGHDVVAASRTEPAHPAWGPEVTWARVDVTDPESVGPVLEGADGVCYLVHSLDIRDFGARDLAAAQTVRDAVAAAGVRRVVYLSGLVPDAPRESLSAHLASRLEVEEALLASPCPSLSLRAGVVIGAGSTSYEVVRQLARLLPVLPVPRWLRSQVQPVSVTDVVRALVEAFEDNSLTGALDVGGPDVVAYPRLLTSYAAAARLPRVRVPVLFAPRGTTAVATAALVAAPFWTVTALVDSLRHTMVCRPGHTWVPKDGKPLMGVDRAMRRAVHGQGLEGPLPGDPDWTRMRAPVLDELHAPASVRAAASLALRRARSLVGG